MRRGVTFVLLGLGVFGIATGLLLRFYAYPALAKIPHDPKTTAVAQGSGVTALVYVEQPEGPAKPEIRRNLSVTSSTQLSFWPPHSRSAAHGWQKVLMTLQARVDGSQYWPEPQSVLPLQPTISVTHRPV